MNLLLLLSALLSALAGVGTGTRQQQPTAAVVQQAQRAIAGTTAARIAVRPVQTIPALVAVAASPVTAALTLPAVEPRYLTRLRE